ncbi:hypothetical protein [Vibrio coralliilyticus]|uniref:hypothetical protein n=1 Tax=Vibrio coralliilyticus TaxID=190893 RepID=UPI000BAAB97A|nr:hypothetical protein [Vibrio coralliilyticus]NOI60890.1 hypothetical protein [Vibrio coralliilyticus]PAT65237.1 hypothetical protein CKA27_25685 [Vibrio coralliilyticus]
MTDVATTVDTVSTISNALHPSLFLTPLGWIFILTINVVAFRRAELSRIKDKVSTQIEDLFKDIGEKISKRSCTENALDDLLAPKITLLELRLNQFSKKSGFELLGPEFISEMRDKPFDWLTETGNIDRQIADFEYKILEELENNYSSWLFEKWWKATFRLLVENWKSAFLATLVIALLTYYFP